MKLFVYWGDDIRKIPLLNNIIYLVSSFSLREDLEQKGYKVIPCLLLDNRRLEKIEYMDICRDFFSHFDKKYEVLYNSIHVRVLIPILSVIYTIKDVFTSNNIQEIELFGGADIPFFSLNGAEGEGELFMYKREWMMNYVIFHSFKDKCVVHWSHKESKCKIKLILWLRDRFLLYKSIASIIKHSLTDKDTQSNMQFIAEKNYNLFLCPLKLQYAHLRRLSDAISKPSFFITNTVSGDNIYHLPTLPLSRLLKIIKKARLYTNKSTIHFYIPDVYSSIKFNKSFIKSLELEYLSFLIEREKYLLLNEHTNILENASRFINNKTIGPDAYLDSELSNLYDKDLITLQYVLMPSLNFPCHKVFKRIYFYSNEMSTFFRSIGINAQVYHEPLVVRESRTDIVKNITLFLQPDSFTEPSFYASVILARIISSARGKYHLFIKPHYRQLNTEQIFNSLKNDKEVDMELVTVLQKEDTITKILSFTDISVGFHSAVLVESILGKVPTVSILANKAISEAIQNDYFLSKVAYHIDGLEKCKAIIDDFELIVKRFDNITKLLKSEGFSVNQLIED